MESKILVNPHRHPKTPNYQTPEEQRRTGYLLQYWSPYDLLGLFFALLAPAPPTADAARFYLPLTAVYGQWCCQITGHADLQDAAGLSPYMLQCTWMPAETTADTPPAHIFFLGASLGGFVGGNLDPWHKQLLSSRYRLVWFYLNATGIRCTAATFAATEIRQMLQLFQRLLKHVNLADTERLPADCPIVERFQRRTEKKEEKLNSFPKHIREKGAKKQAKENIKTILKVRPKPKTDKNRPPVELPTKGVFGKAVDELCKTAHQIATQPQTRFGNCAETYPFMNLLR